MGVRDINCSLERWQMGVKGLRRRMILAPTPRERERWYAILDEAHFRPGYSPDFNADEAIWAWARNAHPTLALV